MHTTRKELFEAGFRAGWAANGPRSSSQQAEMDYAWDIFCGREPKVGSGRLISAEAALINAMRALKQELTVLSTNKKRGRKDALR